METSFLLAVHAHASPWLDRLFVLSHQLGAFWSLAPLVLLAALIHRLRWERRIAGLWLVVGVSTYVMQEGLKRIVDRPRPQLWPRLDTFPPLVDPESYSFPSGHALASATLYPLLAFVLTRRSSPGVRLLALALGGLVAFWIGFGRLYLGVHWPSDVVAGWALGALQAGLAIRWVGQRARPEG